MGCGTATGAVTWRGGGAAAAYNAVATGWDDIPAGGVTELVTRGDGMAVDKTGAELLLPGQGYCSVFAMVVRVNSHKFGRLLILGSFTRCI